MRVLILFGLLMSMMTAQTAPVTGTTVYHGKKFRWVERDGFAVTNGDIILGTVAEIRAKESSKGSTGASKESIAITDATEIWPNGVVPYVIVSGFPQANRITDAMAHWQSRTPIRFVARTNQRDYVRFQVPSDGGCFANVGRVGGLQTINLGSGCETGAVIHEIGHAVGLWHEQARQDRDFYITTDYSSIDKANFSQYDQQFSDGFDVGYYDYYSIMHYQRTGFNSTPAANLLSRPVGIPVGQRLELSPGDIDAINRLYGGDLSTTTVTTTPPGLQVLVDGQAVTTPRTFTWAQGSTHTIDVPGDPQSLGEAGLRYRFARWSDNASRQHAITVNNRETTWYSANFIQEYQLPITASTGGKVTVSPASADGWYVVGPAYTLTAVPDDGYKFVNWTGSGYLLTNGNANNPYNLQQLNEGASFTANFTRGAVTRIDTNATGAQVDVDGTTYALPAQFAFANGSAHTFTVTSTTQTPFNSVDQLTFGSWSNSSTVRSSVTATNADQTITSNWTRNVQVLTDSFGTGGSVLVTPGSFTGYYPVGTTLQFTPQASRAGVSFLGWSGDATGSATPLNLTINGQTAVYGSFAVAGLLTADAIVNAGSYGGGSGVAPGQLVAIFGAALGPDTPAGAALGSDGRLASEFQGTKVTFDGVAAPISYLSNGQLNVVVPYSVAGKATTQVAIVSPGRTVNTVTLPVLTAVPGVFTADSSGSGNCACLNENGSANSAQNPAVKGSVVVLYATGEGQTSPAGVDGQIAKGATLPKPVLPVTVKIAGRLATVDYAGAAPGLAAGVMQVNVRLPQDIPSGNVPVQLIVGGIAADSSVTVAVQ